MKKIRTQSILRIRSAKTVSLLLVLACCFTSMARIMSLPLPNQGYVFLHPFFKARPWKASLERLDLTLPDTLSSLRPVGFDVAQGRDSAMAVFSVANGDLLCMPARYQALVAPCYDNSLQFDSPKKVALNGLALPADRRFYVVKDSLYSFDSLRIALRSAASPLKLYIATVRSATMAVARIDSVTLAQRRTGQSILGVFGNTDTLTGQDLGLWITGTNGLIRYVSYTNRRWSAESVRDLSTTPTVSYANSTYAGTLTGQICHINAAATSFDPVATAPSAVGRIYNQGAIGNGGMFMENLGGAWSAPYTFGSANYRYANFILRSGGLGVELLDSAWAYSAFTYRDSSSTIVSTTPAQLMTFINQNPYVVKPPQSLDITITLNDPDSSYSDYKLTLTNLSGTTNLKAAGKYVISAIPDSEMCHIGAIKMTSGRIRLSLTSSGLTVKHDCALGALNPTCLTCYWKKSDSLFTTPWGSGTNSIILETGHQRLNISYVEGSTVSINRSIFADGISFKARFNGGAFSLSLPQTPGQHAVGISVFDLQGHLLSSAPVNGRRSIDFPPLSRGSVVIVCCRMSDGSVVRQKVPIVK